MSVTLKGRHTFVRRRGRQVKLKIKDTNNMLTNTVQYMSHVQTSDCFFLYIYIFHSFMKLRDIFTNMNPYSIHEMWLRHLRRMQCRSDFDISEWDVNRGKISALQRRKKLFFIRYLGSSNKFLRTIHYKSDSSKLILVPLLPKKK